MEMFCPQCMGSLICSDGKWATCSLEGKRFKVLFLRTPFSIPKASEYHQPDSKPMSTDATPATPKGTITIECPNCRQKYKVKEENVGKAAQCKKCGLKFQITKTKKYLNASSAQQNIKAVGTAPHKASKISHARCVNHPEVRAEHTCAYCGISICEKCLCVLADAESTHICLKCAYKKNLIKAIPDATTRTPEVTEDQRCMRHPTIRADHTCAHCGTPICKTCEFPQADGTYLCADCTIKIKSTGATPYAAAEIPAVPVGQMCTQHPKIQAIQICKTCGAAMCATCDFVFPGDIHVCPTCATAPPERLKGKRRTYLIWSFILAIWSTLALIFFLSGGAGNAYSEADAEIIGIAMSFFILIPSIIGTALGCSATDKRLSNPLAVWIALIWNGIIVGLFVLLCIIGLLRG